MISRIFLALALVLTGCSTFTDAELAQIRRHDLRPALLAKLERRRPLEPEDLIELKRAGVSDAQVEKHLNDVGVNYVVTRGDAVQLRKARVSPHVIDTLLRASERFAGRRYELPYENGWYYGDPWGPGFYGDWSIGYERFGRGWHDGHHHR